MNNQESPGDPGVARRREILRQASVALQGRIVAVWEVSARAQVLPILTSVLQPPPDATSLDLTSTLQRWSAPIIHGSRSVGCRLDDAGRWCIATVRNQPPA